MTDAPTRTVSRALALLDGVTSTDGGCTLSDAARHAGLSTSTALRLLRTLDEEGYLTRDDGLRYVAGPALLRLGASALRRSPLFERAGPALQVLAAESGETANLGIREGGRAVYLRSAPSPRAVRHVSWIGHRIPLQGTALGAALRDDVGPAGFVVVQGPPDPEVTAVAAPVLRDGEVLAALSLTGPAFRFPPDAAAAFGPRLVEAAADLAGELGVGPDRMGTDRMGTDRMGTDRVGTDRIGAR